MYNKKLQASGLLTGQSFTALQAEKKSLKKPRLFCVSTSLLAFLLLTSFPVAVSAEQATSKIDANVTDSARLDTAFGGDTDGDGVSDGGDNCTEVANAGQQDSDGDGIGNACDADFNNDCTVNFVDLQLIGTAFLSNDPLTDLNSDGLVNFIDISIFVSYFLMPPGPSGVAVCGENASFELLDPTPGPGNGFGNNVLILENGNIVVSDPLDSGVATSNGAIHLYDPSLQVLLGSVYGDNDNDRLGLSGGLNPVIALANSNYVVSSRFDDVGGVTDTGSVRLISGETGVQIGIELAGDDSNDGYGTSRVIALPNGNYVLLVQRDDAGGITDAGSVRLMDGTTGVQIGDTLVGDTSGDFLTSSSVTALVNNNYVVAAPRYNVSGIVDVGSVWLMDGATGMQIGSTLVSDNLVDNLGLVIEALPNGNYVVGSSNDAVNGQNAAGSARLMNGSDATQIGALLSGSNQGDRIGAGVTALGNNNYVVYSERTNIPGVGSILGSAQLMNGVTGTQIGSPLVGQNTGDQLSLGGVIALPNNNYVVVSYEDNIIDNDGLFVGDVGSIRLMSGATGAQIGLIRGDQQGDQLGSSGVTALTNGNYVVRSERDEINGDSSAGSVRLVSGTAGAQIGATLFGDEANDRLGNVAIAALPNGNYVVPAPKDGLDDAGSVKLMDGSNATQIGASLEGVVDFFSPGVTSLANSNYVVVLPNHEENSVANTGSVQLLSGETGVQIGDTVFGTVSGASSFDGDLSSAFAVGSNIGDFYILAAPFWDNNGVDTGLVRLIAQ